jgi:small subunit ribosomal protein S4
MNKNVLKFGLMAIAMSVVSCSQDDLASEFKEIKEMSITVPAWMTVDIDKLEGKVVAVPRREEIDTPIAEHLIVELYSK